MVQVYSVAADGSTNQLSQVHCRNEDQELQLLLDRNPDLLPGDQINPDDPRRWLVIEREMPVPDPNTGENRWNIDFLMADQDALPTFVEVKRFRDTRARREVIGQMLEYAANGHYYWKKDQLREYAERTAERMGSTLEDRLAALAPRDDGSTDAFFDKLQDNLREGQVRLVFFLEESPMELRSLVDFLNRQMERSEVLLVEARMFEENGTRFVVPSLFGYSEEARRVKRVVTVSSESQRQPREWDEVSFLDELGKQTDSATVAAVERIIEFARSQQCEVKWGCGKKIGSIGLRLPAVSRTANVIFVNTNGQLGLWLALLDDESNKFRFADTLKKMAAEQWGLAVPEDYRDKWLPYRREDWIGSVDAMINGCRQLWAEFG